VSDQRRQKIAPSSHRDLEPIFHRARQIADPADRAAYIESVCGTDDALRSRVLVLLAAEEEMRGFLQNVEPDVPG
jgi:hypothetical protein